MSTTAAEPTVTPTASITTRSSREAELQNRLLDLAGQAQRCVVDSDDAAERATTLAVAIKNGAKALDADMHSLTDPLRGVIEDIRRRYKLMMEPAEPALTHLLDNKTGQLAMWNAKKRRAAEEAAERARAEAERVRLEEAQRIADEAARLKAAGDAEAAAIAEHQADEALNAAVTVPADIKPAATVTRGIYGGSSGSAKVGKFRITDMAALLAHELANVKAGRGLTYILSNDVELGKLARQDKKKAKPTIPGVEWYEEESSRVWG